MESTEQQNDSQFESIYTTSSRPVSKTFLVSVGASINFLVEFAPKIPGKMAAELRFSVFNNPFEDNVIQLIGEGYEECVTIDNITSPIDVLVESSPNIIFDGDEVIGQYLCCMMYCITK